MFIYWTDKYKFTNNGVINKQNNRCWADKNPYWTIDTNHQKFNANYSVGKFSIHIFMMICLLGGDI